MTAVTASMVKALRDKTGAGMMDCKTALTETKGDMEKAVDWLRKKGLSKAAKKADRMAAEGLIGVTAKRQGRRHRRGQLRDRLRRPQRAVPGHGAHHRRAGAEGQGRPRQAARHCPIPGKGATVDEPRQGDGGHHRREHERAPHGRRCRCGTAWWPTTCTTRSPTASARSACWWRSRARATGGAGRAGPPARHAYCRREPRRRQRRRARSGPHRARARRLHRAGQGLGQAAEIAAKMVEGRLRKEFFQQVVLLQQTFLGAGGDGKATVEQVLKDGGEDRRRAHQNRQVRALRPGRGHRQEGQGFRRRGGRGGRQALTRPGHGRAKRAWHRHGGAGPGCVPVCMPLLAPVGISSAGDMEKAAAMSGSAPGLRYKRLLLKLSGEALMGKAGYGIDVDVVHAPLPRDEGGGRSGRRARASWWAAATSSAALPAPPRAWTAPRPTTWACWPRS